METGRKTKVVHNWKPALLKLKQPMLLKMMIMMVNQVHKKKMPKSKMARTLKLKSSKKEALDLKFKSWNKIFAKKWLSL